MNTHDSITSLKTAIEEYATQRRETIVIASDIQTLSKRAIFAFQRGDYDTGKDLLEGAHARIKDVKQKAEANPRLIGEGAYRASLEEYAEAEFFRQILEDGAVVLIDGLDEETQVGGLSDMIGEVVRRMTVLVTEGQDDEARALKKAVEPVMEGLHRMEYRGSLRSKYDQAVRHYRKTEDILYDISLKR